MKNADLIIAVFGFILSLLTGFKKVTKEKVPEIGDLELNGDRTKKVNWLPVNGIAVMRVGGIIFIVGGKER